MLGLNGLKIIALFCYRVIRRRLYRLPNPIEQSVRLKNSHSLTCFDPLHSHVSLRAEVVPSLKLSVVRFTLYKDWVNAGITKIRDICYEAIPGFLRLNAVHEILQEQEENENRTKQQTKQEFDTIKGAIPPDWKHELEKNKDHTERLALQTTQPRFEANTLQANQTTKDITELKTSHFYRQLMHDKNTTIPALEYWRTNLQPSPTIDSNHWKTTYFKIITNKQGDVNRKISLRIRPTARSLHRMRVYPTDQCHLCNEQETIEHILIHCTNADSLWPYVAQFANTISNGRLQLTNTTKILGPTLHDLNSLTEDEQLLIHWLLTVTRCALHKSAVDYRVRGETVSPRTLFTATVKSHITHEYKLALQRNSLDKFIAQWCIRESLAKIVNNALSINI